MKTYTYTTPSNVAAERLFRAISDIKHWPTWDRDLEATKHDGNLAPGTPFTLKPKGAPKVAMEIVEAKAPTSFVDLSHLPLAKMRTTHKFTPAPGGARIEVKIEIWGPLGFLWDRIVARKQAAGAAEQTHALVAYAAAAP